MDALRLYARYVAVSLQSQLEYRASFVLHALAHFLATGVEFVAIAALFERFGNVRGWTLGEIAVLYGMVNVAFALAEGLARGFDTFPALVKSGEFDRLLLRPRSLPLQIAASEVQLMRVGRLVQGAVVLWFGARALGIAWTLPKLALLVGAILGGACTFAGLFVLQATMAFWTVETLEILNAVTYGGTETAQFPISIYRPWFRAFFTFAVPLACANYFPVHAITGRVDELGSSLVFQCLSPGVGVGFLLATLGLFRLGVRRYCSTGS